MAAASANEMKSAEAKLKVLEKDVGDLGKQVDELQKEARRGGDGAALEKIVKRLHITTTDLQKSTGKLEQRVKYLVDTTLKSSKDIAGMAALVKKQHQELEKQLDSAKKTQSKDKAVFAKIVQSQAKTQGRAEALVVKAAAKKEKEHEQEMRQRDKDRKQQLDKLESDARAEVKKAVKESEKIQKEQLEKVLKSVVNSRLKNLEAQVAGLLKGR